MRGKNLWLLLLVSILVMMRLEVVHAIEPETLLMPGKVVQGHAKFESDCSKCHDRTDRTRQTSLCLDCHKEVAGDVRQQTGFHGRNTSARTAPCQSCHTEHRGRQADIVKFNASSFDHDFTDFALTGAHRAVVCGSCHAPQKPYRKAPSTCAECHKKQEPHQGRLGTQCDSCHNTGKWQQVKFDHDKTDYPLRGRHVEVTCAACHVQERYKDIPSRCVDCHAADDVHKGSRGQKCEQCHKVASWEKSTFDHARVTGFPLLGEHGKIACQACHRTGVFADKLPKDCSGCHKSDDRHAGRFGADCGSCHTANRWSESTFDHDKRTKFVLRGAHKKLDCHSCHTAQVSVQKPPTDCHACHRADDVHKGAQGTRCQDCHNETQWRESVRFDHDLTQFPLVGLHVAVPCESCHASRSFEGAPLDCNSCHKSEDVHKGSLGPECADCHSPNGWSIWQFDHGEKTGYALTGAHDGLQCAACHRKPPSEAKLSRDCAACHARDDVHAGRFGRNCSRCHNTRTFSEAKAPN